MTTTTYASDRTALLIVDPYNDFMSEGGRFYEATRKTAEAVGFYDNMRKLIPAIRAARIQVIIVPHHRWREGDYKVRLHPQESDMNELLNWEVFVTPGIPTVTSDLPPGTKQLMWSPISSTLIYGRRDAVLVDAFITVEQEGALLDWIAASGKNLTMIYATHGHGDHFFGASTVLQRFPRARLVAAPDVVKIMRQQASPQALASFWNPFFPGQISDHLVIAEELTENVMDLEGHDLVVVPLGHTDTDYTTCLHVPSIGLVVAGDAAYNGVHLYLAESNPQTRREWISGLDTIESLNPRAVIAGHKKPENDDSPKIIEETRQYIRDFDRVAGTTTTARELYDKMLELYPDRVNPGALWLSARAVKP